MPECERCGETHATVNEATWVNQSTRLCPSCWAAVTEEKAGEADLEAALDGLMAAAQYAEDRGLEELTERLNACYQDLGARAPRDDWSYPPLDELETVEVDDA